MFPRSNIDGLFALPQGHTWTEMKIAPRSVSTELPRWPLTPGVHSSLARAATAGDALLWIDFMYRVEITVEKEHAE